MKSGDLVLKRIEESVKDMSKDEIGSRYLIWIE